MAETTNAKRTYYSRGFLNPEKGVASWEAKTSHWHENCVDAVFRVSDCFRTVSLDFEWDNAKERSEKLQKLETLLAELTKFREDLLNAN